MKSKYAIIITVLLSLLTSAAIAQDTVKLTNGEWSPYTSKRLKNFGVFSHIVSEAFLLEGIRVEYAFFPWQEALELAKEANEWEGSIAWAPTADREKDFYFTEPVTVNRKVFFHLKSLPFQWDTVDDLVGLKLGAVKTYTYGKSFDKAAKTMTLDIEFVDQDQELLKKLMAGRIRVFPMEIEVGYSLIYDQLSAEQAALVTNHPKPVLEAPLGVIISKNIDSARAKRLVEALNRGLARLKKSGAYEEMIWASRQGKYKTYSFPDIERRNK